MSLRTLARRGRSIVLLSSVLFVAGIVAAEARPGGGKSSGSRGTRTMSAPAPTATAPQGAQPMQRTQQPATAPSMAPQGAANSAAAAAAQPSRMRGIMTGVAAGLLGAGLFGLLTGSGLFGGLSGLASILGFLLQIALVAGLAMLAFRFFRRRQDTMQPAYANAAATNAAPRMAQAQPGYTPAPQPVPETPSEPVELTGADFDVFETRLKEVMSLYSQGHLDGLRRMSTPEMGAYFEEDLAADAKRGVVDQTKDVALLQGDLSEAWRENGFDYATVAMRFGFINTVTDKKTGAVIEGSATERQEATEYWTFVRPAQGGQWRVSAIQQVG
jgi:predicted lipid-binding transport protein (Tim44 family)